MSDIATQLTLPLNTVSRDIEPLSQREEDLLKRLERSIEEHLKGFKIVGHALSIIKEEKLYRADYDTFEEYCAVEWEISRPRAYQLTDCYMVLNHLSTMVDNNSEPKFLLLPVNERQTRPLTYLPMEQQGEAWAMVIEESERQDTRITGAFVQHCIDILRQKKVTKRLENTAGKSKEIELPSSIHESFNSFVYDLKANSVLVTNPGYKRELVKMLKEILETIEG